MRVLESAFRHLLISALVGNADTTSAGLSCASRIVVARGRAAASTWADQHEADHLAAARAAACRARGARRDRGHRVRPRIAALSVRSLIASLAHAALIAYVSLDTR